MFKLHDFHDIYILITTPNNMTKIIFIYFWEKHSYLNCHNSEFKH